MFVLTVTKGPDKGTEYKIADESRVIIGRGSRQFKLADRMVSHAHARLKLVDGEWFIRDIQSRNGTFVNGIPVLSDFKIDIGDEVTVGFTVLRFDAQTTETESDSVSMGEVDVDALESLNLLPDESRKFETIESLINLPDDDSIAENEDSDPVFPEPIAETNAETAELKSDSLTDETTPAPDVEPVAGNSPEPAAEPAKPAVQIVGSASPAESQSPPKPRKSLTPTEAAGMELIGVLAFDQVSPMVNRQVDGTDLETPMDPAPRANDGSEASADEETEGPANEWKSLLDNTVSTTDGQAWDDDEGEENTVRADSAILEDLSKEESPTDDAAEENDISFEEYILEQQRIADAEAEIENAVASRKT